MSCTYMTLFKFLVHACVQSCALFVTASTHFASIIRLCTFLYAGLTWCYGLGLGILTHLQHYVIQNYTHTLCDYDNTSETQELMCTNEIVLCPYKLPKLKTVESWNEWCHNDIIRTWHCGSWSSWYFVSGTQSCPAPLRGGPDIPWMMTMQPAPRELGGSGR